MIVATVLGAAAGYSPLVRRLLDPSLQALRAIPSIAWVPLFVLWLGIFEASKITLIAVGVFFPVYLGVMGAIQSVDRKLVEVGRAFRLSDVAMVRRILLPAVLPAYVISLRSGLGLGWMFVAAAELLGASEGLGYLLIGRPAARQAGRDRRGDRGVCGRRQGDRLAYRPDRGAIPALGRCGAAGLDHGFREHIFRHPSRLAEPVIGTRDFARSRWLAPRDDGSMLILDRVSKTYPNGVHALGGVSIGG